MSESVDFYSIFADEPRVTRALVRAARDALIRHKALGFPIAIWQDGQVVMIPPEDIEIPEDPDA